MRSSFANGRVSSWVPISIARDNNSQPQLASKILGLRMVEDGMLDARQTQALASSREETTTVSVSQRVI